MNPLALDDIRLCLEGIIPAIIATCAADGTPNVAYLSQVYYVDPGHVALSFQFFNKTRQNILANPDATLLLLDPHTFAFYRLGIRYLHTQTEGPVFESMRAQLAGIASHSGMADVFELKGADLYAVRGIEPVPGDSLPPPPPRRGLLGAARRGGEQLARSHSLDEALAAVVRALTQDLGVAHAMVLLLDPAQQRLYTVASHGYARSGVGSEIALGQGVIGMAARARTPVRISHVVNASLYSHAARQSLELPTGPSTDIPYPGLPQPHSQMAVPVASADRLLGVVFVESTEEARFGFEDEDVLVSLASHLGTTIDLLRQDGDAAGPAHGPRRAEPPPAVHGHLRVHRYRSNNSIFLNGSYLIKGVAGAIFWKLLQDYLRHGRTAFTNRELRLDPGIGLPDVVDNLEARLILLERRLAEQPLPLRIEKTGRGQFRLCVGARVEAGESE
ncbi:GAF domain-containing protein [Ottowia sp.]|uniref:GAF domain-containing protein n=1 Tax=Ottowia sp. TaxID=1898956 RepID=UPI0025F4AD03|nr:GAF domain-containing protein [Ottowia sp.]